MPLFARADPDLKSLLAYMLARAEDRGVTLQRTKLAKLLYLIDVERARSRRTSLTGLEWSFTHYGPHSDALIETLKAMMDTDLATPTWKESRIRRGAPEAPDGNEWPAGTKATVDRVMDRFAGLTLDEVLDHVYFATGPMRGAERGAVLDMERARADALPGRAPAPPAAPAAPADIAARLAAWRERRPTSLLPLPSLRSPADPVLFPDRVRGRLAVPAGSGR